MTGGTTITTDYAGNYIYETDVQRGSRTPLSQIYKREQNGNMQFFNTPEGYVEPINVGNYTLGFKHTYQYKDHLNNIRLSYNDLNQNTGTISLSIVEENNYYPFGLKHRGYNGVVTSTNPALDFKFNGVEFEESLGLNVYEMDYRQYDPSLGRFQVIDPLGDLAPMHNPYRFGYNNPVYWKDPCGLIEFEYDKNGKATSFKTSNKDEIAAIMGFLKQNEGANAADLHTFVFEDMQNENSVFSFDLQEVVVGNSKNSESRTLDASNFLNERIGDGAEILGSTKNKGGSFAIWSKTINTRSFDGIKYGEIKTGYYANNWTGNPSTGKTYNISKVIKNGTYVTTVILGSIEIGQGVAQDHENYQNTGYTNGKNTAVASGKVVGGGLGAWAGAKGGAAIGFAFGSAVPIVGTVAGAIGGGIIGAIIGSEVGSSVGENAVQAAYR